MLAFSWCVLRWYLCDLGFNSLLSSIGDMICKSFFSFLYYFRLSRWNYTEIFSDFDEETFDSKADNMDVDTVSGRYGKAATSRLKSKSLVRWVVIFMLMTWKVCIWSVNMTEHVFKNLMLMKKKLVFGLPSHLADFLIFIWLNLF